MPAKTVGEFTLEDDNLYGPKEYMQRRGNAKLDVILAGEDAAVNTLLTSSPDPELTILNALHLDYVNYCNVKRLWEVSQELKAESR